ncbi:MAG: alpha/beta hydrolase [Ahrensia sp.]|nr:alpha/beta hydrolase [Ahrensia sp.]
MWRQEWVGANGQQFHVMTAGPRSAPTMVMLHGFPEYWVAWKAVAERLSGDFHLILPDQRGFNLSSKPDGVEVYETKHLVADLDSLLDVLAPDDPIILCGHDWGASVAYAYAMRHHKRVSHLVIANGVHPVCFQRALLAGGAQTDASQYMNILRRLDSDRRLATDGFSKLMNMFESFSSAPWLDESTRQDYREAWGRPGALPAMLNWYRGSPMIVPDSGSKPKSLPITAEMHQKYRIRMPHLLLWGMDDVALLPEARADLGQFCDDLTLHEISNASHWILHEQPDRVARHIRDFLA